MVDDISTDVVNTISNGIRVSMRILRQVTVYCGCYDAGNLFAIYIFPWPPCYLLVSFPWDQRFERYYNLDNKVVRGHFTAGVNR